MVKIKSYRDFFNPIFHSSNISIGAKPLVHVVSVAQLVEHWVVASVVVGSSPITHPIKILSLVFKSLFNIFLALLKVFIMLALCLAPLAFGLLEYHPT